MDLADLIAGLDVRVEGAPARSVRICDVTDDSRTVVPGSLFIARAGRREDGRRYIDAALADGAAAVLTSEPVPGVGGRAPVVVSASLPEVAAAIAERFYGSPTSRLRMVGVTGTNGKTTTAHLVHQLLNEAGMRCGLIGTVVVDDGREVAPATLTTPPATELSRTLATMVESGCGWAAMEVSSHALEQRRAAGLRFDAAVFTNLTGDHLDYHGTMEAYAAAKARLFGLLKTGGVAIVNAEDAAAERMVRGVASAIVRCRVVERDEKPGAGEALALARRIGLGSSRVVLRGPWGEIEASIGLAGRHNVMNALQACVAAHAVGLPAEALASGLSRASAPPGRLERVSRDDDPFAVLVDYAHTDDALRSVLGALRPLMKPGARLIVVFGCGGDRDRTKRPRMGEVAVTLADRVHVTSDNPRTEPPRAIIDDILAGVPGELRHRLASIEPEREASIRAAIVDARPGDVVLIAGKGHETEQLLPDGRGGVVRRHFDDREVARGALDRARRRTAAGAGSA